MVLNRAKHIIKFEDALHALKWNFAIHYGAQISSMDMLTCDQIITPAKNARVCSISFSALRPASTTNSPEFCSHIEKSDNNNTTATEA